MWSPATSEVTVHERVVLRKFDGDATPGNPPIEVLLVEDGVITGRWEGKEVANAPTE